VAFAYQPVTVRTNSADEDGRLVFADGNLIALLVRLSDGHADMADLWFLEACFTCPVGGKHPIFRDPREVEAFLQ
jgi:hypothetical protein